MSIYKTIQNLGLSEKAAKVYLAALEGGEQTIQQLAKNSGLKRTTIYYTIEELLKCGSILEINRRKKTYFQAESLVKTLKRAKERVSEFEDSLPILEQHTLNKFHKPQTYLLQGDVGFKQIWEKVLESGDKEFLIITEAINFLDIVKEKYIIEEIIQKKKQLGIKSRQLIKKSFYSDKIIAKDKSENRISKILPAGLNFPYTEIICQNFTAFISPKWENLMLVVESHNFSQTQKSLFECLWQTLPPLT